MDSIYLWMIIALAILAIADLIVGVSNDAVNFLNSAIGSKAISFKTIMIVASVGIAFGALSSSGMMEVARKGIFVPSEFYFDEIMIIFMAVMITDILLLDFFNSIGLPTSTTVSIVFELLGAAVCISIIKMNKTGQSYYEIGQYINSDKATQIIIGILLSVAIAFTVGALVQFVSRYLLTFNFEKKPSWVAATFGGLAITSIAYFIIIKGLKGAEILPEHFAAWAKNNLLQFIGANALFWTLLSYIFVRYAKVNIYKQIIIAGTFALAMAFAGNDLVNFIGVPIAAYQSYLDWTTSGTLPSEFSMESLAASVQTKPLLLLAAGLIMVLTLWFSEKARRVVKTSVDLSRQDDVKERFNPNWLSQQLVRVSIGINQIIVKVLPESSNKNIQERFTPAAKTRILDKDAPAFDMVRAAINLVVASVLISIATGMKLPLSTTYVTFMVAMGTSLADRAWGRDSAVYRVAGVINVIGGWFMTAITAFFVAALLAFILHTFGGYALIGLLILAALLIIRSYVKTKKSTQEIKEQLILKKAESSSIQGIIEESANNVVTIMKRGSSMLDNTVVGLSRQQLKTLKLARQQGEDLTEEMDDLKNHVFFFIKNLEDDLEQVSRFYLLIQDTLEDLVQSLSYMSKISHKHIKNNHQGLRFNQIRDLQEIKNRLNNLFDKVRINFETLDLDNLPVIIDEKQELFKYLGNEIEKQIQRTKDPETSSKNSALYFSLLLESKDVIEAVINLLEQYYREWEKSKKSDLL